MSEWTPAKIRLLVILLAALAVSLAVTFYRRGQAVESDLTITAPPALPAAKQMPPLAVSPPAQQPQHVIVHVAGAVSKPGVYRLPYDARVEDAIKAAGGAQQGADLNAINLAAPVQDGSRVFVPSKTEELSSTTAPEASITSRSHARSHAAKFSVPGKQSLNINTASSEQLQRLPGVGPAMAARILQYRRETGAFTDPEQLMEVSGIGPKKFARIKPFVRVQGPAVQGTP